jgi:hypothetical protein
MGLISRISRARMMIRENKSSFIAFHQSQGLGKLASKVFQFPANALALKIKNQDLPLGMEASMKRLSLISASLLAYIVLAAAWICEMRLIALY